MPPPETDGAPLLGIDMPGRIHAIDQARLRHDRLERPRRQLARHDYAGTLLSDPVKIRYATGTRNITVWTTHAPGRYALVPMEGTVLMFEFQYPVIADRADFAVWGDVGNFENGMVVRVESYIGACGGTQGVKLEQQYIVTERGALPMSRSRFTDALEA